MGGNGESRDLSAGGTDYLRCGPLKRSDIQPVKAEVGLSLTKMCTQHTKPTGPGKESLESQKLEY